MHREKQAKSGKHWFLFEVSRWRSVSVTFLLNPRLPAEVVGSVLLCAGWENQSVYGQRS